MRKGRRKSDFENTNEELNGSSEDIGIRKCRRKGRIGKINE